MPDPLNPTPESQIGGVESRPQPRSIATGRFGSKSGESQRYLGDLVSPHDSGQSIMGSILKTRAPNAWRILEQLLR